MAVYSSLSNNLNFRCAVRPRKGFSGAFFIGQLPPNAKKFSERRTAAPLDSWRSSTEHWPHVLSCSFTHFQITRALRGPAELKSSTEQFTQVPYGRQPSQPVPRSAQGLKWPCTERYSRTALDPRGTGRADRLLYALRYMGQEEKKRIDSVLRLYSAPCKTQTKSFGGYMH
jgi:hypothetical protein